MPSVFFFLGFIAGLLCAVLVAILNKRFEKEVTTITNKASEMIFPPEQAQIIDPRSAVDKFLHG